jgi:hypothetical protein
MLQRNQFLNLYPLLLKTNLLIFKKNVGEASAAYSAATVMRKLLYAAAKLNAEFTSNIIEKNSKLLHYFQIIKSFFHKFGKKPQDTLDSPKKGY